MGNTCIPVADPCHCMAKPLQYCKVISLQLKKINLYFKKTNLVYESQLVYEPKHLLKKIFLVVVFV